MITRDPASSAPEQGAASAKQPAGHCVHCGQLLLVNAYKNDRGDAFCCEGCLRIHGVLASIPWGGRYYDLLSQGGRSAPQADPGAEYRAFLATLDDPQRLLEFGRWTGTRHALTLESAEITCAACGWLLENLLREAAGVAAFEVDFIHAEVFVAYDASVRPLKRLLADLAAFGYRLKPRPAASPGRAAPDRSLLYRLAVSGFCFANAMAFAMANYVGLFQGIDPQWRRLFGALGLGLTLPAVAYAAFPFYSGAWRVLRARRFNIDVTVTLGILLSLLASVGSLARAGLGNYSDTLTGLIFFLLLGRWGVRRFEAGLALKGRWFEALRPGKVRVRRGGATVLCDCADVREGETVEVAAGDHMPLDGVLDSDEAWVDASLLTGESRPARLRAGDPVFAGTVNLRDAVSMIVTGSGGSTRIARLGRELEELAAHRRPMSDGAARVARWFTLAVACCAAAAFALHLGEGWIRSLYVTASVFIISCSCALALAVPISRGLGLKRALALGFHFKSQATLESLRDIRCVLLDKTGTLTFMRRTVSAWDWQAPWGLGGAADLEALKRVKALARHSLHPVSVSLARALETLSDGWVRMGRVREIEHFGMVGELKAGPWREICICRYAAWADQDGAFAGLGYPIPLAADGGPIPACDACVFFDGRLAACIRFTDEIKPDVPELVKALEARGVAVALLSGDNREKVERFARACGIGHFHAGLDPEAKKRWAGHYRYRHGRCLAVGDGFNDSLLFGAADLAMAIQGGAVDLSPGTDILFTGARLSALSRLFTLSASVGKGIRASYWISAVYNAAAVGLALFGYVTPLLAAVLMPLSSLSICLAAWLSIPKDS